MHITHTAFSRRAGRKNNSNNTVSLNYRLQKMYYNTKVCRYTSCEQSLRFHDVNLGTISYPSHWSSSVQLSLVVSYEAILFQFPESECSLFYAVLRNLSYGFNNLAARWMTANQLANPREAQARAPKALDKRWETWRENVLFLWHRSWGGAGVFLCHFLKSKLSGMPPSTERVI